MLSVRALFVICVAHWAPHPGRSLGSLLTYSSCARAVSVIGALRRVCGPPPPPPVCLGLGIGGMEGEGLCAIAALALSRRPSDPESVRLRKRVVMVSLGGSRAETIPPTRLRTSRAGALKAS